MAVCDASQELLEKRRKDWNCDYITTDYEKVCSDPNIDAVIIATPNFTHEDIAVAAAKHGKHIMCEKPLGLNAQQCALAMYHAARDNKGRSHDRLHVPLVRPSMRYLASPIEIRRDRRTGVTSAVSDF